MPVKVKSCVCVYAVFCAEWNFWQIFADGSVIFSKTVHTMNKAAKDKVTLSVGRRIGRERMPTMKQSLAARDTRRAGALFCTLLLCGALLLVKLYTLAMYDNTSKQVLSGQYTRSVEVASHTGFVYDRDGLLLSHRVKGAIALVNPAGSRDKNAVCEFLAAYSELPFADLLSKLSTPEPFSLTLSSLPDTPAPRGVAVYVRYDESTDRLCRHLLGYRDADGSGHGGIYEKYQALLGTKPAQLSYRYLADASGDMLNGDAFTVVNRGYTDRTGLVLTIDRDMQETLEDLCDRYLDMGAAVVCDLSDFSIAALCSRPVYDSTDIAASLDSERGEFLNRAFARYTPGSVFKTVVAAAALETNPALYNFEYECTGSTDVSGQVFHCHELSGHGVQTMKQAYANSCNTYFIALAEQIGLAPICETAERFGLGSARALDGLYIKGASLPDASQKYSPAYLANISFGQGDLLVSPMDMLAVFGACATGRIRDFTLVRGVYRDEEMTYFAERVSKRVLSEYTVEKMREMMRACVKIGTGWQAGARSVAVGGKTATAQSGQFRDGEEILHRWFAGVFPIDEPRYALVVLCDGNGENTAAPAKIFSDFAEAMYAARP